MDDGSVRSVSVKGFLRYSDVIRRCLIRERIAKTGTPAADGLAFPAARSCVVVPVTRTCDRLSFSARSW